MANNNDKQLNVDRFHTDHLRRDALPITVSATERHIISIAVNAHTHCKTELSHELKNFH